MVPRLPPEDALDELHRGDRPARALVVQQRRRHHPVARKGQVRTPPPPLEHGATRPAGLLDVVRQPPQRPRVTAHPDGYDAMPQRQGTGQCQREGQVVRSG